MSVDFSSSVLGAVQLPPGSRHRAASRPHWRIRFGRLRQSLIGLLLARFGWKFLHLVPGSSRHFGPPRRRSTIEAYLQRHPGRWIPLDLPVAPPEASPLQLLDSQRDFVLERLAVPAAHAPGVMVVSDGRVLDLHGWPIGRDDSFLFELAYHGARPSCALYSGPRLGPCLRLRGRTLNLASCWADRNFGHFFLDVLPRVTLVERAGFAWDAFDHILVSPSLSAERTKAWLRLAGVRSDRVLFLKRRDHFVCDQLVQPAHPAPECAYPGWVVEFHRRYSSPLIAADHGVEQPARRLFISREGYTRNLTNHREIAALLAAHGFESFHPGTPEEDARAFAQAAQIVGLHGAGLAPLAFCRPGTKVLELTADNHIYPFYSSLAAAGGLNYGMVTGPAESRQPQDLARPPDDSHFTIDPAALVEMLRRMEMGNTRLLPAVQS